MTTNFLYRGTASATKPVRMLGTAVVIAMVAALMSLTGTTAAQAAPALK